MTDEWGLLPFGFFSKCLNISLTHMHSNFSINGKGTSNYNLVMRWAKMTLVNWDSLSATETY